MDLILAKTISASLFPDKKKEKFHSSKPGKEGFFSSTSNTTSTSTSSTSTSNNNNNNNNNSTKVASGSGSVTVNDSTNTVYIRVEDDKALETFSTVFVVFGVVWMLIVGVPAVYLSWTSNTLIGWHVGFKIFFAIFAFLTGLSYLLTHLINKLDLINFIKRSARSNAQPAMRTAANSAAAAGAAYRGLYTTTPSSIHGFNTSYQRGGGRK